MKYRRTHAEINLKNIYDNYSYIQNLNKNKVIIPVVKANGYGHGSKEIVNYLVDKGVTMFAVSLVKEALELRKLHNNINILVMGVTNELSFNECARHNYTVTISNYEQLKGLDLLTTTMKVHIKVDTGMNRLGFKGIDEINKVIYKLKNHKYVYLEGIYTHFATSDCDEGYFYKQKNEFEDILKEIDYDFDMVHCSNSASAIKYEKDMPYTTHIRLGISLYGLSLEEGNDFLKPALKLYTHISEIKYLNAGDYLGYGITYQAKKKERVAVLPIGYADGFIRKNQGGYVGINGKRYQIVGTICMDQCFVRIDETVDLYDNVCLMGGIVSTDEVAARLDTINYEVVCILTARIRREYTIKEWSYED